ncbi:carbohydrate-binding module family 18 protein [Piromyces sp. E2]|nr:carbohydrate-binding module family 18 protein [Piromyces sp. E2]|eukprot:OUM60810.1 carbohydrate-binding module family 18 protein [Piromyces sp. E2]
MKFINLITGAIALISSVSAFPDIYSRDKCGPNHGNAKCDPGFCCSEYGWCGKSEDHCSLKKGCQPNFGTCEPSELPLSKDECGEGIAKCYPGYCCSKYGWCGKSDDHCSVKKGCQSEFGDCNGSGGSTTTTITTRKTTTTRRTTTSIKPAATGKPAEWAGFRFSQGAVKKNYNEIPSGNKWLGFINKFTKYFKSSKPTVIVIVSENSKNVICRFGFPKPKGVSETEYLQFSSEDRFEAILSVFDKEGVNVWLQVEPGNNDLVTLAKIVFNQYGHHSCVQGFGIDLEWWYRYDTGKGKPLDDIDARKIVEYVTNINSKYTVFAKHWKPVFMPPNYRENMVFIDDSKNITSLNKMTKEFSEWAREFHDNPVMYQIGYEDDYKLWKKDPIQFAKTILEETSKYNDRVGIIWVDFTMKTALEMM